MQSTGRSPLSFLSCLCGSELVHLVGQAVELFLSCLCGSEQGFAAQAGVVNFLSCLCGSEHRGRHNDSDMYLSELPMRQ